MCASSLSIELFLKVIYQSNNDEDPILNLALLPTIATDLIMLENQIPFFILQQLFDLMKIWGPPLTKVALIFLSSMNSLHLMLTDNSNLECDHLLHLLLLNCLPSLENDYPLSDYSGVIPSTSELQEARIKSKKGDDACSFLRIK